GDAFRHHCQVRYAKRWSLPREAAMTVGVERTPSTTISRPLSVSVMLTLGLTLFSHKWRERLPEFRQSRHDARGENRANFNIVQLVGGWAGDSQARAPSCLGQRRD